MPNILIDLSNSTDDELEELYELICRERSVRFQRKTNKRMYGKG